MAYAWTPNLETGNSMIDSQHKQLFAAIDNLLDACSKGQGRNEIAKTTKFLYDYTSKHFSDEERLQQSSKYPDYVNHKKYHEDFKQSVLNISKELDEQGPTIALVAKINFAVGDWLVNHIKKEDVKVAAHVKGAK